MSIYLKRYFNTKQQHGPDEETYVKLFDVHEQWELDKAKRQQLSIISCILHCLDNNNTMKFKVMLIV